MSDDLHDEYYVRIFRKRDAGSDEYHDFLHYIGTRYVEPQLRTSEVLQIIVEWLAMRERLYSVAALMRDHEQRISIGQTTNVAADIDEAAPTMREAIRLTNSLLIDTSVADVIEEYFDALVEGLTSDGLPPDDAEALRQSGSSDPRGELATYIRLLKSRKQQITADRSRTFAQRLQDLPETVTTLAGRFRESHIPVSPKRGREASAQFTTQPRRVYKGLGQVVNGSIITVVNVGSAVNSWHIGHPVDISGLMTSVGTGVGLMLMGKGDLNGE